MLLSSLTRLCLATSTLKGGGNNLFRSCGCYSEQPATLVRVKMRGERCGFCAAVSYGQSNSVAIDIQAKGRTGLEGERLCGVCCDDVLRNEGVWV